MDQHEEQQEQGVQEVDGAGGLRAAEQIYGNWNRRDEGRGHRRAGPYLQGDEDEDYADIAEALEQVIGAGFSWARLLEAQVVGDGTREGLPGELRKRPVTTPSMR